ncbi:hypothetical protein [Saccharopolyspora sp. CA-218241]|uniref:hypothetical protein n=1 Tax=Saccharopolyspora sp. CA-218241 TaxID=3240027 RepID=UPI003D99BDBF
MIPTFGATAWGAAWVRTVETTAISRPDPALPRARSLARKGAVTGLTTEPGRVSAEVAGHRVAVGFPLWEPGADRLVAEADTTGLAAGDLPDELVDRLRPTHGIAPPPDQQHPTCSCRTRAPRCAHVLATLYALAQHVDERPLLAVELRLAHPPVAAPPPDRIPLADLDPADFYRSPAALG